MPLARHDDIPTSGETLQQGFYSHASYEAWHWWYLWGRYLQSFYSHASYEAWPRMIRCISAHIWFLLTCLLRGMTKSPCLISRETCFYSHASYEAWQTSRYIALFRHRFYSHASYEAWQRCRGNHYPQRGFYSHASYEAWPRCLTTAEWYARFYSHASYEAWPTLFNNSCRISIVSTHMPLTRHDPIMGGIRTWYTKFLLTCLLRGMTGQLFKQSYLLFRFYSHASYEAWHDRIYTVVLRNGFYSHASYEAWRWSIWKIFWSRRGFYSHASYEAWHFCSFRILFVDGFLLTCLLRGMTPLRLNNLGWL